MTTEFFFGLKVGNGFSDNRQLLVYFRHIPSPLCVHTLCIVAPLN